jgi:putative transposase
MIRFSFRAGLVFVCGGVRYTLVERLVTGKFRLESSSEEEIDLPPDDINRRWLSGEWVLDQSSLSLAARATYVATPADLATMPARDRETIERKLAYLLRIERGQRAAGLSFTSSSVQLREDIEAVATETKDPCRPSPATVWRWWKRYSVTRCPSSLRRRPYARKAAAPTIKALYQEAIAEVFLTRQRKPRLEVWETLNLKVHRFNAAAEPAAALACPSRATVYRWVNALDPVVVHRAREGHKSAAREFRVALQGPRPKRILERVEIDHTPLDLLIIDKATRLLLGRPWVTFVIDVRSRCVLGFYVGFRAPAATSVLLALKQAMLPKDLILSRYPDVQARWPCRGVPDLLVCDNGMELHADAVRAICYQMGVELQYWGSRALRADFGVKFASPL